MKTMYENNSRNRLYAVIFYVEAKSYLIILLPSSFLINRTFTPLTRVFLIFLEKVNASRMTVRVPPMAPGTYTMRCYGPSNEISFKGFIVYNLKIKLTDISPKRIPLNTAVDVTVGGTGFVNTGELMIMMMMMVFVRFVKGLRNFPTQ